MGRKKGLICGVGVNDSDYVNQRSVDGSRKVCPIYMAWTGMIERCYSEKYKLGKPTYADCKVCQEWLVFSNFISWMEKQDWKDKHLDKDILFAGNRVYSPESCVFVNSVTNSFLVDQASSRGEYLIGVYFDKYRGKFRSQCRNPFTKKNEFLGRFSSELTAHLAWKKRKHELACQLADLQTDERVAAALRTRYLGDFTNE